MEIRKIFIVIFQLSLYIGKVFYYDVHNVVHWKWREGEKCFGVQREWKQSWQSSKNFQDSQQKSLHIPGKTLSPLCSNN